MSHDERERSRSDRVPSIDAARAARRAGEALVRAALERATDGAEPRTDRLLDAVPRMLGEARRRRGRRDALAASVPLARAAIPRLAAAAALLVALSATLVLTGDDATSPTTSWDQVLVTGGAVSDDLIVGTLLDEEEEGEP
jgi:hypothetical protein